VRYPLWISKAPEAVTVVQEDPARHAAVQLIS